MENQRIIELDETQVRELYPVPVIHTGNWAGYKECHLAPDWLLVYKVVGNELRLARTGTHSDLFG